MRLLLDANIPRFAAVSAYKKIREETITWGRIHDTKDVLEWCPPPYDRAPRFFQQNVPFIPALAQIADSTGGPSFFTYELMDMEFWNVRPAFDWANRDIRYMFKCKELPFNVDTSGIVISAFDPGSFPRYLNSIPDRIRDKKLTKLILEMGQQYSRDCVHMWFADHNNLDGLITMDKNFAARFNQIRKRHRYQPRAFSPAEIGRILRIAPIGAGWFTARADPHIFYVEPQSIPVGEYLFDNVGCSTNVRPPQRY